MSETMIRTIYTYVFMFFACSMMGWMMEVICKLIQYKRFINRGFLMGPYCPIYGVGSVLLSLLLSRYTDSVLTVFVLAMVICGTLEYLTSYLLEKLFHARWWDYSQKKFNLNGRVCADTLIPFGILGVGIIYFVKPFIFRLVAPLSLSWLRGISWSLLLLLLADAVISSFVLGKIRHESTNAAGDSTESITKAVREEIAKRSAIFRRQLQAFPDVRLYNKRVINILHETARKVGRDVKEENQKIRDEITEMENEIKKESKSLKK